MEVNPPDGSASAREEAVAAESLRIRSERHQARRFLWHRRRRRVAGGANMLAALLLAAVLLVMLNYAVSRYLPKRWTISSLDHYSLSERTLRLLREVQAEVRVVPIYGEDEPLGDEVRRLLDEFVHAASQIAGVTLNVEPLDPDRDLVRVREIAERYDVHEAGVVLVIIGERHRVITEGDLVDFERLISGGDAGGALRMEKKKRGFRGEQAIASAIQSLALAQSPIVYFVTGHGERDLSDFSNPPGYGSLARLMRRDNVEARNLLLAEVKGVPDDASVVVVAGPTRQLAQTEVGMLSAYLERSGRLLLLMDPGDAMGLEPLLETWGVRVGRDLAVGLSLTGRDLLVRAYGNHPVTDPLKGVVTMFYSARSVEPMSETESPAGLSADRPRVTALTVSAEGWAEFSPAQSPPRFDAGVDRAGPVSVAVAVERGVTRSIDMELRPTRLLVIGDSDFVCNGALRDGVGGNADLMLNAINWLSDREALLEIPPKAPIDLKLDMDRGQARLALLIMVVGVPVLAALAGFAVWIVRRR